MDSEAEATIARSYYKFQNNLMIMPKIIPYGNKTISDYKKDSLKKPKTIVYKTECCSYDPYDDKMFHYTRSSCLLGR